MGGKRSCVRIFELSSGHDTDQLSGQGLVEVSLCVSMLCNKINTPIAFGTDVVMVVVLVVAMVGIPSSLDLTQKETQIPCLPSIPLASI